MSNSKRSRARSTGGRFASEVQPVTGASAREAGIPDLRDHEHFGNRLPVYNATWTAVFDDTGARR